MASRPLECQVLALLIAIGWAGAGGADEAGLPRVKFFYYQQTGVEWVVSAEPDKLQRHLEINPESQRLFESVLSAVNNPTDPEKLRKQLARWLTDERHQFDRTGDRRDFRRSEGITAYLRAYDFDMSQLVRELKERSGASDVELVAVHLVDETGQSSFKLKVVLVGAGEEFGQQSFNVDIRSPEASGISVVFALGRALYDVHEIINMEDEQTGDERAEGEPELEPIPSPEIQLTPPGNVDGGR